MHCVQIHEKKIKTVHDFGHFYATLELERCINAVIDCFSFFFLTKQTNKRQNTALPSRSSKTFIVKAKISV